MRIFRQWPCTFDSSSRCSIAQPPVSCSAAAPRLSRPATGLFIHGSHPCSSTPLGLPFAWLPSRMQHSLHVTHAQNDARSRTQQQQWQQQQRQQQQRQQQQQFGRPAGPVSKLPLKRLQLRKSWRPRGEREPGLLEELQRQWKAWSSNVQSQLDPVIGRLSYDYYLWRQGTHNDLILIILAFMQLVVISGVVRLTLMGSEDISLQALWEAVYNVLILSFGQQFPEGVEVPVGLEVFSVFVAIVGLASFALVLALVEQIVLEVIDSNVRRGSKVYEEGHTLVLGWCNSQRDLEVVWKLLAQLCGAYEGFGGRTVVVLTQRSKLEMENLSRKAIPDEERCGTRFVFREGSPLVPDDLRLVGTDTASTIVVISDQSRRPDEADAQTVRCAILVYDMNQFANTVVEIKTSNALPLITYSCGFNVTSVPTTKMNVRRLSKMIRTPYLGLLSQQIMDYRSGSHWDVQRAGNLAGTRFGDLSFRFPQALVLGLFRADTREPQFNPDPDYLLQASDEIVMVRAVDDHPTCDPLAQPVRPERAEWTPLPAPAFDGPSALASLGAGELETGSEDMREGGGPLPLSLGPLAATVSWDGIGGLGFWNSRAMRSGGVRGDGGRNGSRVDGSGRHGASGNGNGTGGRLAGASSGSRLGGGSGGRGVGADGSAFDMFRESNMESMSIDAEFEPSSSRGWAPGDGTAPRSTAGSNGRAGAEGGSGRHGIGGSNGNGHHRGTEREGASSRLASADSTRSGGNGHASNSGSAASGVMAGSSAGFAEGASGAGRGGAGAEDGGDSATAAAAADLVRSALSGTNGNGNGRTSSETSSSSFSSRGDTGGRDATVWGARNGMAAAADVDAAVPEVPVQYLPPDLAGSIPGGSGNGATKLFMAPIEYYRESPDDRRPSTVMVFGWGEQSFMRNILRELDHGAGALAPGSTVVFVNDHDEETSLQAAAKRVFRERSNLHCVHHRADPLQRSQLARLEVLTRIKAAIVLCDELWVDPDMDSNNGIDELQQRDMLRLDSMVMIVQLNVRKTLADAGRADAINIICQKVAMVGLTRFEDRTRYPHGISVNFTSFAAKLLAQVAVNPKIMAAYSKCSDFSDFKICDASELCNVGEELTFWDLMARAQARQQVLLGWYQLPSSPEQPMDVVINPCGDRERSMLQVWNNGDALRKFVVLKARAGSPGNGRMALSQVAATVGVEEEKQTQADWVLQTMAVSASSSASPSACPSSASDSSSSASGSSSQSSGSVSSVLGSMEGLPAVVSALTRSSRSSSSSDQSAGDRPGSSDRSDEDM